MLKLARLIGDEPTLLGNLHDDEVLIQICHQAPDAELLTSGIACQPYSRLGDGKCQADARSATLPGTLRIGFLARFAIILLECVDKAKECVWLQTILKKFTEITGYHMSQGELRLQDVWPARRHRWWCVLSHPSVGQIPWHPFPQVHPIPLVAHVLDCFKSCNDFELKNLMLDLYELGRFGAVGFETNEIPWNGQMATALHSCGNQLSSCPCGCRNFPFTDERLAKGGLHGLLVRLAGHAKCGTSLYPSYRHVHPDELALLCGMLPGFKWDEPKLALCPLGQLASPLQSTWIGAFIKQHVHSRSGRSPAEQPTLVLLRFMEKLLHARDQVFGVPAKHSTKVFAAMVSQRTFVMPAISYEVMESPIQHDGDMETLPKPAMPTAAPEVKDRQNSGETQPEIAAETAPAHANHVHAYASVGSASRVFHDVTADDSEGTPAGPFAEPPVLRASGIPVFPDDQNAIEGPANARSASLHMAMLMSQPSPAFHEGKMQVSSQPTNVSAMHCPARKDLSNVMRDPNAAMDDGSHPHAGPKTVLPAPRTPGITATPGYQNAGYDMDIPGKGTTPAMTLANAEHSGHVPLADALQLQLHPSKDLEDDVNMPARATDLSECTAAPMLTDVVIQHDHRAAESPPLEAGPKTVPEALRTPGITATPGDQSAGLEHKQVESRVEQRMDTRSRPLHLAPVSSIPRPTINPALQKAQMHESEPVKRVFAVPDQSGGANGFEANKRRRLDQQITQSAAPVLQLSNNDRASSAPPHPHQAGPKTVPSALRTPGITATPGDQNADIDESLATITNEHPEKTQIDAAAVRDEQGLPGQSMCDLPIVATQIEEKETSDPTPLVEEPEPLPCASTRVPDPSAPAKVTVWLLNDQAHSPLEVVTSSIATPRQLLQAELKINPTENVVFLRSWVNTHLDPDAHLQDHQLIQASEHLPAEDCQFAAAENRPPQFTFPCTRREALWKQQAWVATDEMDFYLDIIMQQQLADSMPTATFFSAAAVQDESTAWLRDMIFYVEDANTCLSACVIENHWIPVLIRREGSIIHFHTTPEGSPLLQPAQELANWQNMTLRVVQEPLPQAFAADCGFQSFAWLFAIALNMPIEAFPPEKAEGWRKIFAAHLLQQDKHDEVITDLAVGGTTQEKQLSDQVAALLKEHGVWQDRLSDRTAQVMSKINHATLRKVITSPKSWPELKAAANHVVPVLKLIMPDELQAQIDARASNRQKYGKKSQAPPARRQDKPVEPPVIHAADLQVPHGVFAQQDGQVLGPLRPTDIGPSSRGIVLIDQQDSQALRKMQMPVSQQGLALVVLATKHNAHQHEVTPIRFPAMCIPTQEPIIVSGYMYQLGAMEVRRFEPDEKIAVEQINTEVVRCLVFRDQAGPLWESMQKQPVKTVFGQEPQLQANSANKSPVIDVWDRQWMTKRFEKSKAPTADLFAFTFRMAIDSVDALLAASGTGGIYYEPRSHCGRRPNETYHVTWLPNMSFQEAKYAQQTAPHATSLTRHGDRYGLRSDAVHAQPIHDKFRPETPLLLGNKSIFTIGPLPYSTTKEGVAKLLKTWQWDARPLQPRGRSPDANGIQWTIQAVEDPAFWIYNLQHGDVLITKQQQPKVEPPTGQFAVIASKKTLDHLGQQDPWLQQDPWQPQQHVKPTSSHMPAAQPSITTAQLANMEASLERKLLTTLHAKTPEVDATMEPSALEERVSQLEHQLSQVQVSQHGIEHKVGHIQTQLDKQSQVFGQVIDHKLQEQMERIENLLIKRSRHESKAKDLHSLPAGLYTVQETHLTANAIADFRKELVWQKTGYSLTHGHPAPPRSQTLSSVGGRHTGVAVLSKFPCRQVQRHWTDAEFSTGRCLTASAFVQEHWLTVGTVYGYNEHRQFLEVQQSTDSLLSRMTSRVLHGAHGMRIMTGDWNLERSQIPQADEWESKGWIEAQQLAQQKWNRPNQSTCKKTSVKDFVYLSPEIVPYVLDVELNWTLFTDHAVVIVHLADFRKPAKLPIWRKPSKLGWPKAPEDMQWSQRVQPHENMDIWYERIWKNAEAYAQQLQQHAKCPTTANMLGRASTKEVHWTVAQTAPVKPNRRGDVQSNLDTSSLQHSRWTKQVRRLQHLTRCLHSQSDSTSMLEHRASLWHKVRTATGFPGGFCAWWAALPKQFVASPHVLPSQIPSCDLAQAVFTEFMVHYRQLETNLSQAKLDHAIQRRAADPNLIYKEPAEPVQTLILRTDLPVSSVQSLDGGTVLQVSSSMPQGQDVVKVNEVPVQAQVVDEQHLLVPDATLELWMRQPRCP
eukprot:s1305_g28.t1